MTTTVPPSQPDTVPAEGEMELVKELQAAWDKVGEHYIAAVGGVDDLIALYNKVPRAIAAITRLSSALTSKVTEEQAKRAWDKVQEDGENLDFESFWEILKEVFATEPETKTQPG
jgi:hypothetical protein